MCEDGRAQSKSVPTTLILVQGGASLAGQRRVVNMLAGPVAGQRISLSTLVLVATSLVFLNGTLSRRVDRSGRGSQSLSESENMALPNAKGD